MLLKPPRPAPRKTPQNLAKKQIHTETTQNSNLLQRHFLTVCPAYIESWSISLSVTSDETFNFFFLDGHSS